MKITNNDAEFIINGRTINYTDYGSEKLPAIIFIHGFPFNKLMWKNQMEAFAGNYRIVAYDILGKVKTEVPFFDFSVKSFVNDLINIMNSLQIDKASVCGLSLGGFVAIKGIESYPDRIESLLISDLNTVGDRHVTKTDGIAAIESIQRKGVDEYNDENLKILFSSESLAINQNEIAMAWEMIIKSASLSHFKTNEVKNSMHRKFKKQHAVLTVE